YQAILDWYRERIQSERERVRELWTPRRSGMPEWDRTPTGEPRPPDQPEELARATDHLYNLMAEEVHYRLLRDPQDGFQTYQLYAQEAFWASEDSLYHLLRSELLWFLKRHSEQKTFDGLRREEMEVDLALRRLGRYNRVRNRRARDYARDIRQRCADLMDAAGPLAQIWLNVLEGETLLYLGEELPRAGDLLLAAADKLESYTPASPFEEWRRRTLLAETYNDLGYLSRTLGWFQKATEWYSKAVTLWRQMEDEEEDALRRMALRAQHANTLNNLAWALAEQGHFDRAARLAEDALDLRQRLGPAAPVAFSLNTLGMIETRADQPHRARVHCGRALSIFRSLQQPRGVGLAEIAMAEALRRMAAIPDLYSPEESADMVREARGYLDDAVEIFSPEGPVRERPRLVEALIERGCLYRLWAWLRLTYPDAKKEGDPTLEELVRRSERDFQRAMEEAGEALPYRYLDALVNLAWLYYYVRKEDRAEDEAQKALDRIPPEYRLPLQTAHKELPHTFYWLLAGKTYLLLGQLAMRRFAQAKEEKREQEERMEHLRRVGEHFTAALAYDELFAYEFRDIRRAIRSIYERLRGLNQQEMAAVHQGIANAIQRYGLREPTRMDRVLFNHNLPLREGITFEDRSSAVPAG
ncbi:MAG: tetratricopeptide repeat protein, partial [Anaerolineae bacterium]